MKSFLLLVCALGFMACQNNPSVISGPIPDSESTDSITPAHKKTVTPKHLVDSLTIAGKTYTVVQGYPGGDSELELRVLYKGDTIYRHDSMATSELEIADFDKDGLTDIILYHMTSGNGLRYIAELIVFDTQENRFKPIRNFDAFPAPQKIAGTKYYYSYHRSGCADENWGSELFYIENFAAIAIGEIEGIGCENEERNGIFIYRLNGEERKEIKAITRKPGYYEDKWEFIDKYWRSNYKKFE